MVTAAALLHVEGLVKAGLCEPPPGPDGVLSSRARKLLAQARGLGWRPDPTDFEIRIVYLSKYGLSEMYERRG